MKKILITGAGSYIGTSFERYLKENYPGRYEIDTVDMIGDGWYQKDFGGYDSVFHVAGIAHVDHRKIGKEKADRYYAVNTDLTIETAKKAKHDGAKQFIFMSSSVVYGDSAPIGRRKVITKDTAVSPTNCYGESKVRAENGLRLLDDEQFRVVVLRPPMVYGRGCKGNYPVLSGFARKSPLFPYVKNERSMLYIENLCEFVRLMIENGERGLFFPQNRRYSNTSELVKMIAQAHGKKIWMVRGFSWVLRLLGHMVGTVNKAFGNFVYEMSMSEYPEPYKLVDLKESVERTEALL